MSSSYSGKTIREIKSTSYEVKYEKYEYQNENITFSNQLETKYQVKWSIRYLWNEWFPIALKMENGMYRYNIKW